MPLFSLVYEQNPAHQVKQKAGNGFFQLFSAMVFILNTIAQQGGMKMKLFKIIARMFGRQKIERKELESPPKINFKIDLGTVQNIGENLKRFGLADLVVRGEFPMGEATAKVEAIRLSDLCYYESHRHVNIFINGKKIGWIADGTFRFTAAPDLRTAVGWAFATDAGRQYVLDYDLDTEVGLLISAFRMAPPLDDEEAVKKFFYDFKNDYWKQIDRMVKMGSQYCSSSAVAHLIWHVATRTLRSKEHPGYELGFV